MKGNLILKRKRSVFYCQMAKEKQLSNRFDVLYPRQNNPQIGGALCLTNSGVLLPRDFGQEPVSQSIRSGNIETEHD